MIRLMITDCLTGVSCSLRQDFTVIRGAVDELHHRLEAQQDELIFTEATPEFQKSMSPQTCHTFFARIRRKFGTLSSSQQTGFRVNHTLGGTFVDAQYRTKFEKGEADEL